MTRANERDEMPNSRTGELIGSVWVTLKVDFLHTTAYNAVHLLKRPKGQIPQVKKCVTFELERRFAKKKGSYEVPNHENGNSKVNVWTQ